MLKRTIALLTVVLDVVIVSFFALIVLTTILQVVLRYGFNASVLGGNEAMEALFIYTTAIGAAAAVHRRQHIHINCVTKLMPVFIQRIGDVLVHLLIAFLNGAMIYYSMVWIGKVGGNESPVMRIPEWTMQISVPMGCSLVIVYCAISKLQIGTIFKAAAPFLLANLITLILITYFPAMSLWLPSLLMD